MSSDPAQAAVPADVEYDAFPDYSGLLFAAWSCVVFACWAILYLTDRWEQDFTSFTHFHVYEFNLVYTLPQLVLAPVFAWRSLQYFGRSALGYIGLFVAAGMLSWCIGNYVWFYFNTCASWTHSLACSKSIEVPYPSIADVFYLILLPANLVAMGMARRVLALTWGQIGRLWWIPAGVGLFTFALLMPEHHVGPIHLGVFTLFDPSYTHSQQLFSALYAISDVAMASIAMIIAVCSRRMSGGMLFAPLALYAGSLFALYLADITFDAAVIHDGHVIDAFSDLMYGTALVSMAWSLSQLVRVGHRMHIRTMNLMSTLGD